MQYSIVCLIVGAQWMVCSVLVFVDLVPEPSAALPESGNNLREDIILCLLETIISCILCFAVSHAKCEHLIILIDLIVITILNMLTL